MKLILFVFATIIALKGFSQKAEETPTFIPTGISNNSASEVDPNVKMPDKTVTQGSVFVSGYRDPEHPCTECERALQQSGVTLADDANKSNSPKRRLIAPAGKPVKDPKGTGHTNDGSEDGQQ